MKKMLCHWPKGWSLIAEAKIVAITMLLLTSGAYAAPEGASVQAGSAQIIRSGASRLDIIQSTQRAAINWQSFNVGQGEHVNFQQPSASSATLNRVIGVDASK